MIHLSGSRFPWILASAGLQLFSQLGYNSLTINPLGYNFFLSWVTGTLQTPVFPLIHLSGSRFPWILTPAGLELFFQLVYNFFLSQSSELCLPTILP